MRARFRTLLLWLLVPCLWAQTDLRGIYIYTNDLSQVTKATATQLTQSFSTPGVDGVAIVVGWNAIEPSMGTYDWTLLDQWIGQVAALGLKIDLVIPAGSSTPSWLFNPAPKGAGAAKLSFNISPHGGQTGVCDPTTIAPPWDAAFLTQWDAMLAAVSAHLKAVGTYNAVTLVRLNGINRTTEEMRLPAETPASTGLACVTDAISLWQQAGYKPSLLLKGWNALVASYLKSFPDKPFAVSIIPNNAFPAIAEDGTVIKGAVGDQNAPLLQSASQAIGASKLVVQFDFLMPGEPVSSVVTSAAQNYGTLVAFQTNEYLGGSGAACSEPVTNPTPCTAATFLSLLETGIYPLGPNNPLRARYIEVFHDNVTAFPASVLQAHNEIFAAVPSAPPPVITSISICSAASANGAQGSCPSGTKDTAQIVLAPDGSGKAINSYAGLGGISDEHQTIFPPGSLNGYSDYVFFVATQTPAGPPTTSLVALSGGAGPDANGQWTLDWAKADGYGAYAKGVYAELFVSSTQNCPTVANAANQDQTFDQSYAAPGSVMVDPTGPAGSMLMIYEGTNTCLGSTGLGKNNFYSMVGAATSLDWGKSWPTYRAKPGFTFTDLPGQNRNQGPNAPNGATGTGVCMGNDCTTTPPASYGRYPVLGPSVSIATAAATGKPVPNSMGDSEMSAFLDDVNTSGAPYVYVVYDYHAGGGVLADPKGPGTDLMIARGRLNGGAAPLSFSKWNGQSYSAPGMGGYDSAIFPSGPFSNCEGNGQSRFGASISYVDTTQQYLLLFVCDSPGDPAAGQASGTQRGAAWFYSTSTNLSDPTQWSPPQEIAGSWSAFDTTGGCNSYPGFYPTAMSLGSKPGHLSSSGYIFYLAGCQTDNTPPPGRQYSARRFTLNLSSSQSPPSITTSPQLPPGTVGSFYSQTLAATGGSGTYTWSGSAPAGLTVSAAGVISGVPTSPGNSTFGVQVTDSTGASAFQTFSVSIASAQILSPDGATAYDPVNNITWLANFNLAATNRFGLGVCKGPAATGCVNPSGSMHWDAAAAWVAAMNSANYLGQNNWQFPTTATTDLNCGHVGPNGNSFGFGCTASALANLYNNGLGLQSPETAVAIPNTPVGGFSNFQPYLYWTQGNASADGYSTVSFNSGFAGANTQPNFLYVLPMIAGKITGAPSGSTVYDLTANVTWLANANIAATNTFGLPACTSPTTPTLCVAFDGAMSWNTASQFIKNMNAAKYLGQTSWQLPPGNPNCTGYNCAGPLNPLAELYSGLLNLTGGTPVVATPNSTVGPFTNIQPYLYWSCTGATIESPCSNTPPSANFEWTFSLGNGFTGTDLLNNMFYVAVYFPGPPSWYNAPVITSSTQLPAGMVGTAYSLTVTATGGAPPYSWSLAGGTLPLGLNLTPDGTVSGTPTAPGTSMFIIEVTDSNSATTALAATLTVQPPAPATVTLYVSPNGNDSWSGTLPTPNSAGTDGPLATFDAARIEVQGVNRANVAQVVVQFRGGTYSLPGTVQFAAADSGSAATAVVYQNYPGETPVFSGGMAVTNWTNAGGNKWTTMLPASTQFFENLFYNGVRRLRPRLGGLLGSYYRIAKTIYLSGAAPPAKAPDPNCSVYIAGSGWECFDRFQYNPADAISGVWKNLAPAKGNSCNQTAGKAGLAGDIEVLVFEQFSTSKLRVSCVDRTNHIMYMTGPTPASQTNSSEQGFIAGNRYLVENVQDALAEPGQWFLDRSTTPWGLTYLANPGENPNNDTVIIPQVGQLLVASNLQYVTFQGLTFEHDNYVIPAAGHKSLELEADIPGAVSFQNSSNITFDSGVVTQIAGTGLEFISCVGPLSPGYCVSTNASAVNSNNVVQNSAFYDIGALGVRIGDPYEKAHTDGNVPQQFVVRNNVVEGYGRTIPASFGIGQGEGHDNLYTHNDVYDGYHCAISISEQVPDTIKPNGMGNANNTISFNHVYNLLQGIMNDGGSIRIEAGNNTYTAPGNKILNNKIHDVTDASIMDSNGYGGDGIYLDNQTGLVDVENNLVYRVSGNAVYTPQGPAAANEANLVKNNILAFGRQAMVSINKPYPFGVQAVVPQNFVFSNNLFYFDRSNASTPKFWVQGGCTYPAGVPYTQFQLYSSNLYWRTDGAFATDAKAFYVQPNAVSTGANAPCSGNTNEYTFYTFSLWQQKVGEDLQSVVKNPGFKNPAYPADDYSLPNGSPGVGFVLFDPLQAGRLNPLLILMPPPVAPAFATKTYNPATDY